MPYHLGSTRLPAVAILCGHSSITAVTWSDYSSDDPSTHTLAIVAR